MCISVPGRVTAIDGALAEVQFADRTARFSTLAQPDVQVGDYVLAHANLIISIIDAEEAQQIIQSLQEMEAAFAEEQERGLSSATDDVSQEGA
jgi:hydrogenase assembly chaperone HypC/HupF